MPKLRLRALPGEVRERIEELVDKGWSAPEILGDLAKKFPKDKAKFPVERTLQYHLKARRPKLTAEESEAWSFTAASDDEARLVLPVLAKIITSTEGRKTQLMQAEAHWIAKIARAVPRMERWQVWLYARRYLEVTSHGEGTSDLDAALAFDAFKAAARPEPRLGEEIADYADAVERGWIKPAIAYTVVSTLAVPYEALALAASAATHARDDRISPEEDKKTELRRPTKRRRKT